MHVGNEVVEGDLFGMGCTSVYGLSAGVCALLPSSVWTCVLL